MKTRVFVLTKGLELAPLPAGHVSDAHPSSAPFSVWNGRTARRNAAFMAAIILMSSFVVFANALAADGAIISFNFRGNGGTAMPSTETAGAPGVNAARWNDVVASGTGLGSFSTTLSAGTIVDSDNNVVPGLTFSASAAWGHRSDPPIQGTGNNDTKMFTGAWNVFANGDLGIDSVSDLTVTLTGIPYAQYDVYIYTKGQAANRGGNVWLGDIGTGTGKSLRHLVEITNASQVTYQEAIAAPPFNTGSTHQGTYLVFRDVTGSSLTLNYDVQVRFPQAGIQIVEVVPEPSAFALLGLGMLGCFALRRRRKASATLV